MVVIEINFGSQKDEVKVHFGDDPFLFNVSEFEHDEVLRQHQQRSIKAQQTGRSGKSPLEPSPR